MSDKTESRADSSASSPRALGAWATIRRHKVVEWAIAYIAFGYAALHGVEMLREAYEWPGVVSRLTVLTLLLGFPVAVTLAYYHGYRARQRISGPKLAILTVLLALTGSAFWFFSTRPRNLVSVSVTPIAPTNAPAAAVFSPPLHSVAVLPFTNLSGDPKQEYFSDGTSEELINALTQSLSATARSPYLERSQRLATIRTMSAAPAELKQFCNGAVDLHESTLLTDAGTLAVSVNFDSCRAPSRCSGVQVQKRSFGHEAFLNMDELERSDVSISMRAARTALHPFPIRTIRRKLREFAEIGYP